jgi:hypothetical protein
MKTSDSNLLSKLSNIGLVLAFGVVLASCSSPGKSEFSDAETVVESEDEPEDDKSQRPSPPASTTANVNGVNVTIDYSAPAVKGRTIWGDLVPYGKVDRTGANEATVFSVDKNVLVNGEPLAAGQYSLFTIPTETDWTVIFNKEAEQWGAYDYKESEDALRITVTPKMVDEFKERLQFKVQEDGTVNYHWEKLTFSFNVAPAPAASNL